MESYTCRTCLSITDIDGTFQIFEKCSSTKSIKDLLLQYIPPMKTTLTAEDRICVNCLNILKIFLNFVDKCLEIESDIAKERINIVKTELARSSEVGDDGEIVENIQIVVEDGGTIIHDHSYIRPELNNSVKLEKKPVCKEGINENVLDQENFDDMGIQLIPISAVTDEMLNNLEDTSNSHLSGLKSNLTVVATDEFMDTTELVQIKEESTDSISDNTITYFQQESNVYICEICGDGFLSNNLLQLHLLEHGEVRIMCDKCPKIFKTDSALKAHYKLKHSNTERYKCALCGQLFARSDYLRNHLKRHEDEDNKQSVKCRVPGKFLRFKNTEEPLPCKICGKYYSGIHKLKVHLQTHLVVKRFACEYCDLTYKRWPSLKRHEKTHLEADTFFYRCNVCWKRFIQKEDLDAHMNQHENPRYRCQVCDEQFHRKYLFDNHYLLSHATPEDIENSKKEVIYDTLLELSSQNIIEPE